MAEETMDVENQIECLNAALRLQHRSVLHYSLVAGSVIGLEYQAHAEKMREHSLSELEDATRLVEKITALGGEPTTEVARMDFVADPDKAIDALIDCESETLEALQAAIEPTGREAASEAVEHRLEHMIMRNRSRWTTCSGRGGAPSRRRRRGRRSRPPPTRTPFRIRPCRRGPSRSSRSSPRPCAPGSGR
jgi:bacterioferritin (cytochrome b1)